MNTLLRCLLLSELLCHDAATAADKPETSRNAGNLSQSLIRAEQALARKSADAAALFEHASHVAGESATAEIGMVRAYMSSGQYRRALSYAHLVQGEHKASTEALAWTALLNDRSGQTRHALSALEAARKTQPDDVALLCAHSEILIDRQQAARATSELDAWLARNAARGPVLALRHHAAVAQQDTVSQHIWARLTSAQTSAQTHKALLKLATRDAETQGTWITPYFDPLPATLTTSTGVSLDDGLHVVAALSSVSAAPNQSARILVRDAQGHVRRAVIESTLDDTGIALLKLDTALPVTGNSTLGVADRLFPGSPFHAVGFAVINSNYPAFPTNTSGFFARMIAGALQQLSSADSPAGAPVFNASGQLAGFVSSDARNEMQRAAPLLKRLGITLNSAAPTARLSNEEIYERALNRVVLVAVTELTP